METFEDPNIDKTIKAFKVAYGGLFAVTVFAICWMALRGIHADRIPPLILNTAIFSGIYLGLCKRKPWVVNVILILSAFSGINYFLRVIGTSSQRVSLPEKFMSIFMFAFFGYQVIYFSKGSVKRFFKTRGSSFY